MTTLALKPKTSPIEELKEKSKEQPKENPSIEMSAKDEIKNRGRKIREIKKALKSMKKISRGTVEDKERIIKLEQILEHYLKEQKEQLSERYNKEFLKTKAYIPSIITKFPKAVGIAAKKVGVTIDQLKLSKTYKEAAYNFFQTMKSIGQTAATPVVYAGKFIIDNWYLSLLLPILKPEIFENLIEKGKSLLSGTEAAEVVEIQPTVVTAPTLNENPTSQVTGKGEIPIPIAFEDTKLVDAAVIPNPTVADEFPDQIDMEAQLAEGNAIEVTPIVQELPINEATETISVVAPTEAEVETQVVNDLNMQYGTLIDENGEVHQVPLVTISPIEVDPTYEQETLTDKNLSNEENQNLNPNPSLLEAPPEAVTENTEVNEDPLEENNNINVPNNNYNVFTLGPWCPIMVLPELHFLQPNQPIGEIIAENNTVNETIKRL